MDASTAAAVAAPATSTSADASAPAQVQRRDIPCPFYFTSDVWSYIPYDQKVYHVSKEGKAEAYCLAVRTKLRSAVEAKQLQREQEEAREAAALAEYARVLKIQEAELEPDHVDVAATLHKLGRCVLEAGRPAEAEMLFAQALAITEAQLVPDRDKVADALRQLGACAKKAGQPDDAMDLFARALSESLGVLQADGIRTISWAWPDVPTHAAIITTTPLTRMLRATAHRTSRRSVLLAAQIRCFLQSLFFGLFFASK